MPFIVGHVIECEMIKGKDNLKKCVVDVGDSQPLTIVTSAPNVRLDTHTAVAVLG